MDALHQWEVTVYDQLSYANAERFLPWRMFGQTPGRTSSPTWRTDGESSRCWYRRNTTTGWQFMETQAASGDSRAAFDHDRLAAALADAGESVAEDRLDLDRLIWVEPQQLEFDLGEQRWRCSLADYSIQLLTAEERNGIFSPDRSQLAFARDHDLWVRTLATGEERRLTQEGTADAPYGTALPSPLGEAGLPMRGQPGRTDPVLWSPDGQRLLTHRMPTTGATRLTMTLAAPLNDGSANDGSAAQGIRPRSIDYVYPLPGDEVVPRAELVIIEPASGRLIAVDIEPLEQLYYGSPIPAADAVGPPIWWHSDSSRCYVLRKYRGNRRLALWEVNATDGTARIMMEESDETPVDANITTSGKPNVAVIESDESVLWYSQRSGWGHLYLYDAVTGELRRQLTAGEWIVADVTAVDEVGRWVYFTAAGGEIDPDPYVRKLFRVSLDGGEPELLTHQQGHQLISFSPDGEFFTTIASMIDTPPVLDLCRADGTVIATLARADFSTLQATGWRFPERFSVTARDERTRVYGVMITPTDFDPSQSYPIIDAIYAGPQTNQAPTAFAEIADDHPFWQAQAIAELGFVVVMIDGLGMPYRSKAFRDVAYRNLADGGLPEHIAAIRQLAAERDFLDADRVGIYGHSAGGYASCQAILSYPDFYRVCVSSAGNHDHRLDKAWWIERYQGFPVAEQFEAQANRTSAHRLAGKLLLIHGEADENVPVAATISLADALIAADKDFDLMILPNRPHACGADPYVVRRRWDYFVQHLAGVVPPEYQVGR